MLKLIAILLSYLFLGNTKKKEVTPDGKVAGVMFSLIDEEQTLKQSTMPETSMKTPTRPTEKTMPSSLFSPGLSPIGHGSAIRDAHSANRTRNVHTDLPNKFLHLSQYTNSKAQYTDGN